MDILLLVLGQYTHQTQRSQCIDDEWDYLETVVRLLPDCQHDGAGGQQPGEH